MSENEKKDGAKPPFDESAVPPMNEEEAIKRQRKQFMLFAIAGLVMLVLAFFAGRTVKGWISDDAAPEFSPFSIEAVVDEA